MACSPALGLSPRHLKDNHLSSHPLDSTWQGLIRRVTIHEVSTCSEKRREKREQRREEREKRGRERERERKGKGKSVAVPTFDVGAVSSSIREMRQRRRRW